MESLKINFFWSAASSAASFLPCHDGKDQSFCPVAPWPSNKQWPIAPLCLQPRASLDLRYHVMCRRKKFANLIQVACPFWDGEGKRDLKSMAVFLWTPTIGHKAGSRLKNSPGESDALRPWSWKESGESVQNAGWSSEKPPKQKHVNKMADLKNHKKLLS